eukprot:5108566-Pyramimonas_sp.AAC.1
MMHALAGCGLRPPLPALLPPGPRGAHGRASPPFRWTASRSHSLQPEHPSSVLVQEPAIRLVSSRIYGLADR